MAQYLDEQGLRTLVTKTKEYANKRVKEAVVTSASPGASKTIIGWNDSTSAATYGDIAIAQSQVTGLVDDLASKAPLDSPAFRGTPTVPNVDTALEGSQQIANTKYVKDLVGNIGEAMHYKGTVTQSGGLPTTDYKAGDTYKVAEAGIYAGKTCEVGDMIIANKSYATGASNADWDVIQTNIDGAVTGPGSATSGHFAIFDGNTGKVIKDAGYGLDHFKTVQNTSAFTNSDALKTINTISQNENGDITSVTFQDIQTASTGQKGVVQLTSTSGTAENVAATPKLATDLYNALSAAKQDNLTFDGTYDASNNKVATVSTVSGAIQTLDATVTSEDGTNVQVKVTEADGKITGVNITTDNTVAKVTDAVENNFVLFGTGGAIKDAGLTSGAFATSAQGVKADSAIQGVKANGTDLTKDGNNYVNIPLAASGTNGNDGLMSKTDKAKLDGLDAELDSKADKVTSATAGHIATLDASGNLVDGGHALSEYKTVQSAVSDPTATGNAISFIDTISQNANGVITPTKKTVPLASASQNGLMSSADFSKLAGIANNATKVNMGEGANSGILYINGVSAMYPINNTLINGLFT